jgi:hypothetical protein
VAGVRFSPGNVVATPGALAAFSASGDDILAYLIRHITGDWGEVDAHDRAENELSVREGFRILSAYTLTSGVKVWVISEAVEARLRSCFPTNTELSSDFRRPCS